MWALNATVVFKGRERFLAASGENCETGLTEQLLQNPWQNVRMEVGDS